VFHEVRTSAFMERDDPERLFRLVDSQSKITVMFDDLEKVTD